MCSKTLPSLSLAAVEAIVVRGLLQLQVSSLLLLSIGTGCCHRLWVAGVTVAIMASPLPLPWRPAVAGIVMATCCHRCGGHDWLLLLTSW